MKKILCFILSCVLCAGLLTGCGKSKRPEEGTWKWNGSGTYEYLIIDGDTFYGISGVDVYRGYIEEYDAQVKTHDNNIRMEIGTNIGTYDSETLRDALDNFDDYLPDNEWDYAKQAGLTHGGDIYYIKFLSNGNIKISYSTSFPEYVEYKKISDEVYTDFADK